MSKAKEADREEFIRATKQAVQEWMDQLHLEMFGISREEDEAQVMARIASALDGGGE